MYWSSIVRKRSNPFLEPDNAKQWGQRLLLKETKGAYVS